MDVSSLIVLGLGLVGLLGFLIFLLLYTSRKRKEKLQESQVIENVMDFNSLMALIKENKTSAVVLKESLDTILKHYGHIPPKEGTRVHPEFKKYIEIIVNICTHPNTSKNIILNFDKELSILNPEYKSDINDAVTAGVKSRQV